MYNQNPFGNNLDDQREGQGIELVDMPSLNINALIASFNALMQQQSAQFAQQALQIQAQIQPLFLISAQIQQQINPLNAASQQVLLHALYQPAIQSASLSPFSIFHSNNQQQQQQQPPSPSGASV